MWLLKNRNLKNINENKPQSIPTFDVSNISCQAFEFFRDYCYGLNTSITNQTVIDILDMSEKYKLLSIQDCCIKYILFSISHIIESIKQSDKVLTEKKIKCHNSTQFDEQTKYVKICLKALKGHGMAVCSNVTHINLHCNNNLQLLMC